MRVEFVPNVQANVTASPFAQHLLAMSDSEAQPLVDYVLSRAPAAKLVLGDLTVTFREFRVAFRDFRVTFREFS